MKKALYYTILGVVIYIGAMIIYFGIADVLSFNSEAVPLTSLDKDTIRSGDTVSGEIYCAVGELKPQTSEDVGGGAKTRRVFVVPLGYEKDIKRQCYILYATSDESDANFLKSAIVPTPKEPLPGDRCVKFKGSVRKIDFTRHGEFAAFLAVNRQLVGITEFNVYFAESQITTRIADYMIYSEERTATPPVFIIIGGAVCAVGIAGIIIGAAVSARRKRLY